MDYFFKNMDKSKTLGFVVKDVDNIRYYKTFNYNDDVYVFTDDCYLAFIFSIKKCADVLCRFLNEHTNNKFIVVEV